MAELKTFSYTPTNWIDGRTAVTAARLNNIENALLSLQDIINEQQVYIQTLETRLAATISAQVAKAQATITSKVNSDVESKFILANTEWGELRDRLAEEQEVIRGELKTEAQVFYQDHVNEYVSTAGRLENSVLQINQNNDALSSRCAALENGQSTVSSWISEQEDTNNPNSWHSRIQQTLALAQEASTKSESAVNKSTAAENVATQAKNNADLQALFADNNLNARVVALFAQNNVATKTDVDQKITDAETAINKATNQKLGTAFGLTVNEDDDVDMTALQTQLQNFAGSTLLTANIITDETEGNQTLTQWLNNKQSIENTNFTNISAKLNQIADEISDIKTKFNEHITNTHGSTTSDDVFGTVDFAGNANIQIGGGFSPTFGWNNNNNSTTP